MTQMIPVVATPEFVSLGEIDDYISFIWTTRFYACGDFELCVNASSNYISMMQKDNLIFRSDDEHIGIIEKVVIQTNEDGQEMMIVSGRFLSSLLARRIIATQTIFENANLSDVIYTLLNQNVINPTIAARKIENFTYGSYTNTTQITTQYTGENLLETISNLCETNALGFKTILTDQNEYQFNLFEGVDHSYAQSANPYVVFSDKYDNLLTSDYEENYQEIATDVLMGGEVQAGVRQMQWVSKTSPTGIDRHEVFVDASNAISNNGIITQAQYLEQLKGLGEGYITTYTSAFNGQVDPNGFIFKKDVNIGDIVTIENSQWGLHVNSRLIEMIESVNESGEYTANPTFGV